MSGDPYRKAIPGERLKIPARAWNKLMGGVAVTQGFGAGDVSENSQVVILSATLAKTSADNEMSQWPAHIQSQNGTRLRVGYGISLDGAPLILPATANGEGRVNDLDQLASVELNPSGRCVQLTRTGAASEQFGVITSVSTIAATESTPASYNVQYIAAGVFVCRCIAFALTDRLLGPPPMPANNNAKPFWYPYPMMAPSGSARVIAYGAHYRVGPESWPRIYEVLVRM